MRSCTQEGRPWSSSGLNNLSDDGFDHLIHTHAFARGPETQADAMTQHVGIEGSRVCGTDVVPPLHEGKVLEAKAKLMDARGEAP